MFAYTYKTTPSSFGHSDNNPSSNQGSDEVPRPPERKATKNARRKKNVDALNLIVEELRYM